MTQTVFSLPDYPPTRWELVLPDYPVILSEFRSAFFPELLGSLPGDSRWKLYFDNVTGSQALNLMLPWRATGMGLWPLGQLPNSMAAGIDDSNFRKRLMGTTWTMERMPQKESIKNGRFNVVIDLIYELTFTSFYSQA